MSDERPGFTESLQVISLAANDLGQLAALKGKVEEQFFRRLTYRNFFPVLEGFLNHLKARALETQQYGKVHLPENVQATLAKPAPRFLENLRAVLRAYAQARGCDTPLAGAVRRPGDFRVCLRVRNRLMHPKRIGDLAIGDAELSALLGAGTWLAQLSDWATARELEYLGQTKAELSPYFAEFWKRVVRKPEGAA